MNVSQQFRFSAKHLLILQFAIAPLFLAPAYADYHSRADQFDPIQSLIWFLVAPTIYVFLMVVFRLRRHSSVSPVFRGEAPGII